jgi:hypothetical protein
MDTPLACVSPVSGNIWKASRPYREDPNRRKPLGKETLGRETPGRAGRTEKAQKFRKEMVCLTRAKENQTAIPTSRNDLFRRKSFSRSNEHPLLCSNESLV